jgi:flagellar biogenesis protein FliO
MAELQSYYNVILIGLAILAAVIVAIVVIKMMSHRVRGRRGQRLGISEYHELDKTRRLVLVRRDNMEHLVLIGGHQDLVIESNIETDHASEAPQVPQMQVNEPIPMRAPPRPAVFGDRRPPLRPVMRSYGDGGEDQAS